MVTLDEAPRILLKQGKQSELIERTCATVGSYRGLALTLEVSDRTLRRYRDEKYLINETIAKECAKLIGLPEFLTMNLVEKRAYNWGAILGGKRGIASVRQKYGEREIGERRLHGLEKAKRVKTRKCKPRKLIFLPQLSGTLAEFCGIKIGDGCMTSGQLTIHLTHPLEAVYATYVDNLMVELFRMRVSHHIKGGHCEVLSVSSESLINFLTSVGLKVGNKIRSREDIPAWIFEDEDYLSSCIRGLTDTDGCLTRKDKSGSQARIEFRNAGTCVLSSYAKALASLGIGFWKRKGRILIGGDSDIDILLKGNR